MKPKPIVWTLAGSDPSAHAGLQADLATIHELGAAGRAVVTAITAQSRTAVHRVSITERGLLRDQIRALADDAPPAAIKIGMVGSSENARVIGRAIAPLGAFKVFDPVLR